MKRKQRLKQILELLQPQTELTVAEACERLSASPATIRRAFVELEKLGQVERTWGGIQLAGGGALQMGPPAFAKRLEHNAPAKRAIARAAAELLKDGDVVMIDGGTTTFQLSEFIARKRIRIITNSLVIAQAIDRLTGTQRGAEVYLCGGLLQPEAGLVVGSQAEAFLRQYRVNWAFLSAAGVDAQAATNYEEAVLGSEQVMIEQAARVALLVDHTKFGKQAMRVLCPMSKVDYLFTERAPDNARWLRPLTKAGVKVTEVPLR